MAKIVAADLQPYSGLRAKKIVLVRQTKDGLVVSQWPRKRGKAKKGWQFYQQREFAIAAQYASASNALDVGTSEQMAKGTEQISRDIRQMAIMGTYYEIVFPDGRILESGRFMTNNPQWVLDLITDVPGAIIYRADIGWVALLPATSGHVLTMDAGLPTWKPGGGGGGGGYPTLQPPAYQNLSNASIGARGVRLSPLEDMTIDAAALTGDWLTGQVLELKIFEGGGTTLGTLLDTVTLPAITVDLRTDVVFTLTAPLVLNGGTTYWFTVSDTTGGFAANLRSFVTDQPWLTFAQHPPALGGYEYGNNPIPGAGMSVGGAAVALRFQRVG